MAALAIAATPSTASPPPDQVRPPATANPSVVCEGDVCRLVRKKRPEAAAEKDETSVAVEGAAGGDEAGAAAPAAVRAVECEGGVCRLVRKKGAEGKKEDSAEGGAGVEASPLGPGDSMPTLRVSACRITGLRVSQNARMCVPLCVRLEAAAVCLI